MKRFVRWSLLGLSAVLILAVAAAGAGYLYLRGSLPQTEGEAELAGLDRPVEVARDSHGIPTIRAESELDAYRALGYLHAQDRLWQMDFMRRTAAGRLSEVVGEGTLAVDRLMRVMNFRGQAENQIAHLSEDTRRVLDAYAEGVNAYLDSDPVLPLEFHILRTTPEPWTPADSLSWLRIMALMLSGNWREEINRTRLAERLDDADIELLYPDYGGNDRATLETARRHAPALPLQELAEALPASLQPQSASNAWAVTGAHSESGGAMLVNDPHLGLQTPGYWYLVRVETPERTLVGATGAGIPFNVLGRNDSLSWGLTTTHSDTQDLFIERVDPDDPDRYLTPDGAEPFETREERITVRGRDEPEVMTVRSTRHGPVISDAIPSAQGVVDAGHDLALAWPALRDDDRTPDAIFAVNRASSVEEALEPLMAHAHSPQQNIHLADSAGNIAVAAPARVPIRKRGDGTLPVPGWDDSYGWDGFIPWDELPLSVNPADGTLINANNRIVPPDYPHLLAANWPPPDRAHRVAELLETGPNPLSPDAMWEMMLDSKAPAADEVLAKLLSAPAASSRGAEAMEMLDAWDGRMDRTRPEPLVYTAWLDFLNRALLEERLGGRLFEEFARPKPHVLSAVLEQRPGWCTHPDVPDGEEASCADVKALALEDALDSLQSRFGGDPLDIPWGEAHRSTFPHPLLRHIPGGEVLFGIEIATDGGDETINRGGARYHGPEAGRYAHVHGPGLRMVHDMARGPETSRFIAATGQSGNPLSQHYGDLVVQWRDGGFLKLVGETQDGAEVLRLTPTQP